MEWRLRKARKEETDRINELYIEMLQSIYHTDQVTGYQENDLDRFFDGRDEWICAAENEYGMIGFLSIEVHHEKPEYLYLDDLSVSAGYRGIGIGTALIGKAEAYAAETGISLIALHVEKTNTGAFRLYERLGYGILRDEGHRWLMSKKLRQDSSLFISALENDDTAALLSCKKTDLHCHVGKSCRREWLESRLNKRISAPPERFDGLTGMQTWFESTIKPACGGFSGNLLRWKGAFEEARRNHLARLVLIFGASDVEGAGGIERFTALVRSLHQKYCPETVLEPEITFISSCDIVSEVANAEALFASGFFRSVDVCGGENIQPFKDFLPLYRKAEQYGLIKRMHVGETGSADDIERAADLLGLDEIHHGIHASDSARVMKVLAERNIRLNVCPTSNVMLGLVPDYSSHPIRILFENGVPVTINTDDLLIFGSSVESEYRKLYQAGCLTAVQLDSVRRLGLRRSK